MKSSKALSDILCSHKSAKGVDKHWSRPPQCFYFTDSSDSSATPVFYCVTLYWLRTNVERKAWYIALLAKSSIKLHFIMEQWLRCEWCMWGLLKLLEEKDDTKLLESFNSFWPSDTIWWKRYGATLSHVMACCLMAPSHYLNQCWLTISEVQWQSYY